MARIIPEVFLRNEAHYDAERRVFMVLRDTLPDDCTIMALNQD